MRKPRTFYEASELQDAFGADVLNGLVDVCTLLDIGSLTCLILPSLHNWSGKIPHEEGTSLTVL